MSLTQEDQAYNKIKTAISKGYIKKGSKLKEIPLAQSLDMSRATVKGAIKRLVFEGLAEHVPYKGVSVVSPTLSEINQTFQVRAQLEQMAVTLAVPEMTPMDYKELEALIDQEISQCRTREVEGYYEINYAFHMKIAERSGNKVLHHYIKELLQKTAIYLVLFDPFFQLINSRNVSPDEHTHILKLMHNMEETAAGEAMKQHLVSTVEHMHADGLCPSDYLTV